LSPEVLLALQAEQLEHHLWAAVRVLTEIATATRQLATGLRVEGADESAAAIDDLAALDERFGETIRWLIEGEPNPIEQPAALARILAEGDD
jgi:hypothetical protein